MKTRTDAEKNIRKQERRKATISVNIGASLLLAFFLVVMLNYLSYRHYYRADWSRSKYYTLSDKTLSMLAELTNRLDVIVFFQPEHEVYEDADNLLKEYEYASKSIHVERVDPDRSLARTEELARKYQVSQANVVVFEYEGRSKFVSASDIVEMDYSGVLQGRGAEKTAFKGEQAFSSAIQSIVQGRKPVVYFLKGHGERDIEDHDQYEGFSGIAQQIRRDNVDVKTFTPGEQKEIPADADAVILAGPLKKYPPQEVEMIRRYLEKSGRVMMLLDVDTDVGFDTLLEDWGVKLGDDVVIDPARTLSGLEIYISDYGAHAITRNLKDVTSIFYLPRSVSSLRKNVETGADADKPHVTELAFSSDASWVEYDLEQKPIRYDEGRDRKGPVSIGVAVEKGPVHGLDMDIKPMRMVVIGDTDFAANGALTGGNVDFFLGSLNWLLEREELLAISPKPAEEMRLVMDKAQLNMLFWVVVVGMPGLVATLGAVVWMRRRS